MIEFFVITGEKVTVIERCGCITLNYIYNGTKVANIVYFYKEEKIWWLHLTKTYMPNIKK